jgi:hypothetical protein
MTSFLTLALTGDANDAKAVCVHAQQVGSGDGIPKSCGPLRIIYQLLK